VLVAEACVAATIDLSDPRGLPRGTGQCVTTIRVPAQEIVASGGRAAAIACDVADYPSVQTMVDDTERQLGSIDILINNASIIEPIGALAGSDPAEWTRSIEVNLLGAYHTARATLPRILEAGKGTVINISSGAAHRPLEGWSAYCSGKAGLAMLTDAIALECGDAGVRVFGLAPGVVDTDMQATIRASGINRISQIGQIDLGTRRSSRSGNPLSLYRSRGRPCRQGGRAKRPRFPPTRGSELTRSRMKLLREDRGSLRRLCSSDQLAAIEMSVSLPLLVREWALPQRHIVAAAR
jgi:NAD(P)-dependent dehydrogenase (short-subunit alcohol dehydrogenase family)